MRKRTILAAFCLITSLATAEDLDPAFRDELNRDAKALSQTKDEAAFLALADGFRNGPEVAPQNADEKREWAAFLTQVGNVANLLRHRPLPLPWFLPNPEADSLRSTMLNWAPLTSPDAIELWLKQLDALPNLVEQEIANLRAAAGRGTVLPRFVLAQMATLLADQLQGPATQNPINAFFRFQVADVALRQRVDDFFEQRYRPAIRAAKAALDDLATRATPTYTLCVDPESYAALLESRIGEPVDPRVLHQQALDEISEWNAAAAVYPGTGTAYERVSAFLKTEPLKSYEDFDWANRELERARMSLKEFTRAPAPDFEVTYQSPDIIPNYAPGSGDGHRPARLNLSVNTMIEGQSARRTLWHEGLPGHALQLGVQAADVTLPSFRMDPWPAAAFEGWAVYAETWMAHRFSDRWTDAGLWNEQYHLAVMTALDTGINALGWTYKEAQAFLLRVEPGTSRGYPSLINHVVFEPTQIVSYDFGLRRLLALRARAQARAGFDERAFHDRILELGPLPFPLLEEALRPTFFPEAGPGPGAAGSSPPAH